MNANETTTAATEATTETIVKPGKGKSGPVKITKTKGKTAKPSKAKKAVRAKKAKVAKNGTGRLVPADLTRYHVDDKVKTAKGHKAVDCNDAVARALRGKDLDQAYTIVAKKADYEGGEKALRARYKHLNVGMQRMNLGNVLRGAL